MEQLLIERRDALQRILDAVASLTMAIAGVMITVLIAIFGWLVFGRYVLNATPTWVEQVSLLIVVWVTFLGAAVGVHRNTHLAVDFIREAMPRIARQALTLLAIVAMCGFGVVMAWQGWVMCQRTLNRAIPLLGISEAWRSVPVVIGGVLITIFALNHLRLLTTARR